MTDVTDQELTECTASPCDTDCLSCAIALELKRRRPDTDERAHLADLIHEPLLAKRYPAALRYIARQIARDK